MVSSVLPLVLLSGQISHLLISSISLLVISLMDLVFTLMKISFGNPAHVMKPEATFVNDHQRVNILKNVREIMIHFVFVLKFLTSKVF